MSYRVLREEAAVDVPQAEPPAYDGQQPKEVEAQEAAGPGAVAPTPAGYMYVAVPTGSTQQQSQTTTVVANQPRSLPQVTVVQPRPKPKVAILIFSLVLTILCGLHLNLPAFVCLAPGLIFAIVGYSLSDSPHQANTAKAFHGVSLCCNIAAIVFYVLAVLATGISFAVIYAITRDDGCYTSCSPSYYHHHHDYNDYSSGYYYDEGVSSSENCYTVCG